MGSEMCIRDRATREPPRDFAQKAKSLQGRVKGADELATAGRLKETIVEIWSNKYFIG